MKFLALAALAPLVSAWSFSTYVDQDQLCSTTPITTVTDAAPGNCIVLPEGANISSVQFADQAGKGPFTGGYELDFYPSMEECQEDVNCSLLYAHYDTQETPYCWDAWSFDTQIGAYKIWNRSA
ncbi:hypothetical protein CONPUDRAFT_143553 [Coniophora puteana RWD-64-598 SS2]|uniref:Uncharacterized protein n=1 Tax=Coniophora puteana (strain RWD-64-598) TaxID=741705 RepID=A0A5M3MS26_CONPW|nr:uncharacterized protein CONPUDRAFT_143553 [Coniophora puteana RWD-64-598 SS2]EIW81962.1 hypothetical protein CONPUDRAFT_143553 [Coniophora puteana RWD-64-598 SS2]